MRPDADDRNAIWIRWGPDYSHSKRLGKWAVPLVPDPHLIPSTCHLTVPIVRHTGGLRDTVFDVDFDKERAAWDVYGSSDWKRDGLDGTNGFAFAVSTWLSDRLLMVPLPS